MSANHRDKSQPVSDVSGELPPIAAGHLSKKKTKDKLVTDENQRIKPKKGEKLNVNTRNPHKGSPSENKKQRA